MSKTIEQMERDASKTMASLAVTFAGRHVGKTPTLCPRSLCRLALMDFGGLVPITVEQANALIMVSGAYLDCGAYSVYVKNDKRYTRLQDAVCHVWYAGRRVAMLVDHPDSDIVCEDAEFARASIYMAKVEKGFRP